MPSCFQLVRKGEAKPIVLQHLDEELCHHLNVPVNEMEWCFNWYNIIGLMLACGETFNEIEKILVENKARAELFEINTYLQLHFDVDSWGEFK